MRKVFGEENLDPTANFGRWPIFSGWWQQATPTLLGDIWITSFWQVRQNTAGTARPIHKKGTFVTKHT